ncbi:hypothetical protein IscW_ISCW011289 [Ixodes scapularis]|uniref:Uncharacterized protein n=1 Tax=Ixodes scapularis TaxID=6945 RepID=B7Q7J0_IXOSC|nr:hypothetical protein IscW_ISCW011289 [Ixodes scapularis]|eukprot:XP_002412174.1 hypothetical protein IscW_ISCW011289 [Ixodes scapularis]
MCCGVTRARLGRNGVGWPCAPDAPVRRTGAATRGYCAHGPRGDPATFDTGPGSSPEVEELCDEPRTRWS